MRRALVLLFLIAGCAPEEKRKVELYDEYVLVEFAAKLEEEPEKFEELKKN